MNKKVTVEQAKKAIKLTRSMGLVCGMTFMFGYPGESLATIKETVDFCEEFLISPPFFYTTPYPGTKLYEEVKDRIIKKYGREEKFIEVLGDASEFTVNLTDFSDEELFKLKEETERRLRKIRALAYPKLIYMWYQQHGLYPLVKHFGKRILNKLRHPTA